MEDEAPLTEIDFKEHGGIDIAGKAGVFPEDDTGFRRGTVEVGDEALELEPADRGGAGTGTVAEEAGEADVVLVAPGADGGFLLLDGEILLVPAGITEVSGDQRIRLKG
jgi:hypothetical protein